MPLDIGLIFLYFSLSTIQIFLEHPGSHFYVWESMKFVDVIVQVPKNDTIP